MAILFNKYVHAGIYPDILKIASIIPLYKSGDKNKRIKGSRVIHLYAGPWQHGDTTEWLQS